MSTTDGTLHHVETGWSPTNQGAMRARCVDCGDYFEAWCSDLEYVTIRHAEQQAAAAFKEYPCPA